MVNNMLDELQLRFKEHVAALGIEIGEEAIHRFEQYYEMLIEWNQRMNLTAITEREEVYFKHFYDSLTLMTANHFCRDARMLDVGAGAGFPGVPVHLVCQELSLTVLDSLGKRISFLEELGKHLSLPRFYPVHGRAEDFGQKEEWREAYDQVTARAVAKLNVLSEYCLPFVRVGGWFFALKGPEAETEVREAEKAIVKLGGAVRELKRTEIPGGYGTRTIVVIEKVQQTPKNFPRKAGTPSRKPLV
ncbi:16S rRNA (guanine(527)-N(7))-methyltransferase RsmG [Collibacillus ludicampi]|nr:16S rRNA (guanine(527)-N(7))-methyltransferase RsmG [Collibacillus ludicampi]